MTRLESGTESQLGSKGTPRKDDVTEPAPALNDPPTASFVVVANRLPVDRVENSDGSIAWRTSPGGLVAAFQPVMRRHRGAWVGWPGAAGEELDPFVDDGIQLIPVTLSAGDVEDYYEGFSNATLWPLYHDVIAHPEFRRDWWERYVEVNDRFAEQAAIVAEEGGTVWVQDYQLQLVPHLLRERRPDLRIGFFLHIPFPPTELFNQLPWRRQILTGLLGADLVGFQLPGGAQNFLRLVRTGLNLEPRPHEPQEVLRTTRQLKAHEVGSEKPGEDLPTPGQLVEEFGRRKGDMQEEADPQIRPSFPKHVGNQLELIVLHPDRPAFLGDDCRLLGEAVVDFDVALPPVTTELGMGDHVVIKRPERGVGEAFVVVLDITGRQGHGNQLDPVVEEGIQFLA